MGYHRRSRRQNLRWPERLQGRVSIVGASSSKSQGLVYFNEHHNNPFETLTHLDPPKAHNFLIIEDSNQDDSKLAQLKDLALALECFDQPNKIVLNTRDAGKATPEYSQTLKTLSTFGIIPEHVLSTQNLKIDYQSHRHVIRL